MKKLAIMLVLFLVLGFTVNLYAADAFTFKIISAKNINDTISRTHLVKAGLVTTYVVAVKNINTVALTCNVAVYSSPWDTWLAFADNKTFQPTGTFAKTLNLSLAAGEEKNILVKITAPATALDKQTNSAVINAVAAGVTKKVNLNAQINNKPKIYIISIDALGRNYLSLKKDGSANSSAPLLMPRLNAFLNSDKTAYTKCGHDLLISATDMNHTALISGAFPGTSGLITVNGMYTGLTTAPRYNKKGEPLPADFIYNGVSYWYKGVSHYHKYLKYGIYPYNSKHVETLFDQAKKNNPLIFNAFVSGKDWLNCLFQNPKTFDPATGEVTSVEQDSSVDLIAATTNAGNANQRVPAYLNEPQRYTLADPPSDSNPADQDNKYHDDSINLLADITGYNPKATPSDRWVMESVLKVISADDPDMLFAILPSVDEAQHYFGAADNPDEWNNTGDLSKDQNKYNPIYAIREATLDVVYEADTCFGMFVDALNNRGTNTINNSMIVLYGDHGQITFMQNPGQAASPSPGQPNALLDVETVITDILNKNGWGNFYSNFEYFLSGCDAAGLIKTKNSILDDPVKVKLFTTALENYEVEHPLLKNQYGRPLKVKPFVVVTRNEMLSGTDNVIGRFSQGNAKNIIRAELFSNYYSGYSDSYVSDPNYPKDVGVDPENFRWPDIMIFNRPWKDYQYQYREPAPLDGQYRFQFKIVATKNVGPLTALLNSFVGAHSGFQTQDVPIVIHGPGIKKINFSNPGITIPGDSNHITLVDIAPTIEQVMSWTAPDNTDGRVLTEILGQ